MDDSPVFLASARALLESQGMIVSACASCSEEALAATKRFEFDLALVDVELAGEDGFVLARSLAAQDLRPPRRRQLLAGLSEATGSR